MYQTHYQLLIISITISINLPYFLCSKQPYDNCKQTFECGDSRAIGKLKFPFWGVNRPPYCGLSGFEIKCLNGTPMIINSTYSLIVNETDPQDEKITVSMAEFSHSLCPSSVFSRRLTDFSVLQLGPGGLYMDPSNSYRMLTILYDCPEKLSHQFSWPSEDPCSTNASVNVHYVTDTLNSSISSRCSYVVVLPILQENAQDLDEKRSSLGSVLEQGFEMKWITPLDKECSSCLESSGECGYNSSTDQFTCYCPDNTISLVSQSESKKGSKRKTSLFIGVSIGAVAILGLLGGCSLIVQKSKRNPKNQSLEDSLKNIEKLGEGGYGTVFKGKLKDGRVVAVKVWKQSKGDGQDFINEIMSISRTSHVNVVPLLGFCYEGRKRVLIYEFMPNGSLEKFLQGRYFNVNNQPLCTQKLFDITIGIARGLEYLHRGCSTRIVHFDIKPHNILLNAEFTPKISDFGLAKSSRQKESIISMSGVRGTAGYIAPEVFLRGFGGVSHKSDVYSFGMMVLEMVGCKKRLNENAQNSSEMYFPHWIYKQLEQGAGRLDCDNILNVDEKELERKMILVGLSCIQTNPMSRPSMSRVVEMLEGKVELLEVPTMPTLASPPRLQQPTEEDSARFCSSSAYSPTLNY